MLLARAEREARVHAPRRATDHHGTTHLPMFFFAVVVASYRLLLREWRRDLPASLYPQDFRPRNPCCRRRRRRRRRAHPPQRRILIILAQHEFALMSRKHGCDARAFHITYFCNAITLDMGLEHGPEVLSPMVELGLHSMLVSGVVADIDRPTHHCIVQ